MMMVMWWDILHATAGKNVTDVHICIAEDETLHSVNCKL